MPRPVHQTAYASASRAATTYYSAEFESGRTGWLRALTDVTVPNGGSVTITLEGYDATSGKWYTLIAGTAISTATTQALLTYPGATTVANSVGQWPVPRTFRVKAVVATAAVTFSVGIES